MKQSVIPWIIVVIMSIYVYGLTYHVHHRLPPEPSYEFYDTAFVMVEIKGVEGVHNVYGRFNNILEGKHQLIKAKNQGPDIYQLTFRVNSPRPAILYVDDEDFEIFLVPGDTSLKVSMEVNPVTYQIDSLDFLGNTAGICNYFQDKSNKFYQVGLRKNRNIIDSENFEYFSLKLDSMAAMELGFLAEQEIYHDLPEWFVDFEKNEVLYHKAYLKLSKAFNREVPQKYLDNIPTKNEAAVFSYYYYLYLNTYISNLQRQNDAESSEVESTLNSEQKLQIADSLLTGEPHDVFMTRVLFTHITRGEYEFVRDQLIKFQNRFSRKKYFRFLRAQLEKAGAI
ncbi:MAG: hypothetical protein KDD63_20240 [Bacteroidetes bacterium]|nr:hypothetical protein [Bacteroidota bacterium]MCB0843001.1 hypothetical protein [Bacteroidota bacterium]MCB0854568.1 hypothetical protein [Bacteroidota bacterium]